VWARNRQRHSRIFEMKSSWKYAGNGKGHACLSVEGFSRRGTTEACLKQKGTVPLWNEWLASSAVGMEKLIELRFIVPVDTKLVIWETFFVASLLAQY